MNCGASHVLFSRTKEVKCAKMIVPKVPLFICVSINQIFREIYQELVIGEQTTHRTNSNIMFHSTRNKYNIILLE